MLINKYRSARCTELMTKRDILPLNYVVIFKLKTYKLNSRWRTFDFVNSFLFTWCWKVFNISKKKTWSFCCFQKLTSRNFFVDESYRMIQTFSSFHWVFLGTNGNNNVEILSWKYRFMRKLKFMFVAVDEGSK